MLGRSVDWLLRQASMGVCVVLLCATVVFTFYTVVMRSVFSDPPFWGDTVTLMANVWLMFVALASSIRERESIAMQMIYDYMPARWTVACDMLWNVLFAVVGLMMLVFGWQAAERIPGTYWELGNLPKSYLMAVLPISGVLVVLASVRVILEDLQRWRSGAPIERRAGLES